ncbi:hypothetical protein GCM10020369_46620 [Cryptosporangium minutisporangium]|uniref:Uncharacterized protein n=1 Tax=Cryptosporangium minutisporangium TaxID=113569 RepID=A0ABP6T1P1_9ACTN
MIAILLFLQSPGKSDAGYTIKESDMAFSHLPVPQPKKRKPTAKPTKKTRKPAAAPTAR